MNGFLMLGFVLMLMLSACVGSWEMRRDSRRS